jgi:hypothetical protein
LVVAKRDAAAAEWEAVRKRAGIGNVLAEFGEEK